MKRRKSTARNKTPVHFRLCPGLAVQEYLRLLANMKAEAAYEIAKPATRALSVEAKFFLLLLSYFGWQVLLRAVTSTTADLDENEQVVMTQKLQWGYGPQP